jgi:transcriptional regulator with XRE-family HTH domain
MISMTNIQQLASAIRAGRAALNWSQNDLAERSGVSLPTVARIESVTSNPRLETVARLIQTLQQAGVDFDWSVPQKDFLMGVLLKELIPQKNASNLPTAR